MLTSRSFLLVFFQAEDGIRDRSPSRGLGDVYKRQFYNNRLGAKILAWREIFENPESEHCLRSKSSIS